MFKSLLCVAALSLVASAIVPGTSQGAKLERSVKIPATNCHAWAGRGGGAWIGCQSDAFWVPVGGAIKHIRLPRLATVEGFPPQSIDGAMSSSGDFWLVRMRFVDDDTGIHGVQVFNLLNTSGVQESVELDQRIDYEDPLQPDESGGAWFSYYSDAPSLNLGGHRGVGHIGADGQVVYYGPGPYPADEPWTKRFAPNADFITKTANWGLLPAGEQTLYSLARLLHIYHADGTVKTAKTACGFVAQTASVGWPDGSAFFDCEGDHARTYTVDPDGRIHPRNTPRELVPTESAANGVSGAWGLASAGIVGIVPSGRVRLLYRSTRLSSLAVSDDRTAWAIRSTFKGDRESVRAVRVTL